MHGKIQFKVVGWNPKKKRITSEQKEHFANARKLAYTKENDIGPSSHPNPSTSRGISPEHFQALTNRIKQLETIVDSSKHANHRKNVSIDKLKHSVQSLERQLDQESEKHDKVLDLLDQQTRQAEARAAATSENLAAAKSEIIARIAAYRKQDSKLKDARKQLRALAAKCTQAPKIRAKAVAKATEKAKKASVLSRIRAKGTYTTKLRSLVHVLIKNGCSQAKVGTTIQDVMKLFGVDCSGVMSRLTVQRIVMEGLIAAKMQLGFEIASMPDGRLFSVETRANALSQVSLSALIARDGDIVVDPTSKPETRFVSLQSTVDHTSETSKAGWMKDFESIIDVFNRSPLASRRNMKLNLRDFSCKLRGMMGDHAANEKKTAALLESWKEEQGVRELGEASLAHQDMATVLHMIRETRRLEVEVLGGIEVYMKISSEEGALLDLRVVDTIIEKLERTEFDALASEEKREMTLFLWCGCCMHKDQNSAKSGNAAMNAAWKELGLVPPMLLANKWNAAAIQRVLSPEKRPGPLSAEDIAALEATRFGGARAIALFGTTYNNSDSKKGQGDLHRVHFAPDDKPFRKFPQIQACRFGTVGAASGEILLHRKEYKENIETIRLKKQSSSLTNIELNISRALDDIPTETEWTVLALYHQLVTVPYIEYVRDSSKNGVELGPFHSDVLDHIRKGIANPESFLKKDPDAYIFATLDGRPFRHPDVMTAIHERIPHFPHIVPILKAFLEGTVGTWIRFSAEYARGGIIDGSSADEKDLAWMPSLEQWNTMQMYTRNGTQRFVDHLFEDSHHRFCRTEEFDLRLAEMKRDKELEKAQKIREEADRLRAVLITHQDQIFTKDMTIPRLQDQLDILKALCISKIANNLSSFCAFQLEIPLKSHIALKAYKQAVLVTAFMRHTTRLGLAGGVPPSLSMPVVAPEVQALDDVETTMEM
ncbi:hypothetical protein C8J56DRAFT_1048873 [Mycena floridula]|nr:hypothetical protein C8J56DRAFT_1048873 [Mycena floridula]